MGTSANYEITKDGKTRNFYTNWDSYPTGARDYLNSGLVHGIKTTFDFDKFVAVTGAEEDANCSGNFIYKINLDTGMMIIVSNHYKELDGGGYNGRYVSFDVEYSMGFLSFLDTKNEDNSVFTPENSDYEFAFNQAKKRLEAKEAMQEEKRQLERSEANKKRLERAKNMNAKEEEIDYPLSGYGNEGKTVKAFVAKNKYIRIETEKETVVFFVGDSVPTGHGSYKYPSFGEVKGITNKTISTIGGGVYSSQNCRLKTCAFVFSNKNTVRM